jgi:hypothetical protein
VSDPGKGSTFGADRGTYDHVAVKRVALNVMDAQIGDVTMYISVSENIGCRVMLQHNAYTLASSPLELLTQRLAWNAQIWMAS